MWYDMAAWKKVLTVLLAIIGILAIVVGVIYIAEPAKSIPHFFPAYQAKSHFHATKHGAAAIVVGVVVLVIAVILVVTSRDAYE
jgi:uncharacterized membrane protein HdeD (DUF308 family)